MEATEGESNPQSTCKHWLSHVPGKKLGKRRKMNKKKQKKLARKLLRQFKKDNQIPDRKQASIYVGKDPIDGQPEVLVFLVDDNKLRTTDTQWSNGY